MTDWTDRDGVCELRLAAPPLNEIGQPMLRALERFVDHAEASKPRAVIVYSDLPRGFCAGADLRELHHGIQGRAYTEYRPELATFLDRIHTVANRLDALPCTTVGVVHGACFGGGFELALTMDVLVADPTARFCFPELRLGLIPGFGGIPRLARELPNAVIRDLLLTGRSLGARRAYELGLVSQVVRRGEGLNVAREVAAQSARFAPEVVASAKAFMKPIPTAELEREKALFLSMFADGRVARALAAFDASTEKMPYLPAGEA
jgi:enoyl-CoA hydratase/carnithine racemase